MSEYKRFYMEAASAKTENGFSKSVLYWLVTQTEQLGF